MIPEPALAMVSGDFSESRYLTERICAKCGTDFRYQPDSTRMAYALPGMQYLPSRRKL